jgi:Ca2+-binding EF-hand superfamily protein
VLKNKLNALNNHCREIDEMKQGILNFEKFQSVVKKLQISDKIINEDDIRKIYDEFKQDEHHFDYKKFLTHLSEFQLFSEHLEVPYL